MSRYYVGNGIGMMSFVHVIQRVVDGDIIEFQRGNYYEEIGRTEIRNQITLIGYVENNGGQTTFNTTLKGQLFISGGVTCQIENIWLDFDREKSNIVNCKENSSVILNNVVLKNSQGMGEVYPIVYAETGHVTIRNVHALNNPLGANNITGINSKILIESSSLYNSSVSVSESELTIKNTKMDLQSVDSSIYMDKSSVACIENTTIVQTDLEKVAVFADNSSSLTTRNCTIIQEGSETAIRITGNAHYHATGDTLTALQIINAKASLHDTTIKTILRIEEEGIVHVADQLNFMGENREKVDVFMVGGSCLYGEKLQMYGNGVAALKVLDRSVCSIRDVFMDSPVEQISWDTEGEGQFFWKGNQERQISGADATTDTQGEVLEPAARRERTGNAKEKLNSMVGLRQVKEQIESMLSIVELNKKRIEKGLEPEEISLHSVFLGNPGTGKTTVARLIGEILWESGAFRSDKFTFIEASEPDFISSNVGGTAEQTLELLKKATGGILFIDEAYSLNKNGSSVNFGQEAINTILKYMEDHRSDLMIIFAGYTKEMEQFLKTNPGLESRVPHRFIFEDFSPEDIVQVGSLALSQKGYILESPEYYAQQVKQAYKSSLDRSNARWIRNFNEKLLKSLADRLHTSMDEDIQTIKNEDIKTVLDIGKYQEADNPGESAEERLEKLIGIANVKQQVQDFVSMVEINQKREEQGMTRNDFTLHSLFLGNPGTGKTTVARIIGELLYQKNIIKQKKFVEVSRTDLVAGYVGQTALKTREVLESALGGVLFIDEAYALRGNNANDFGQEAIDEILKFMEDHRRDMVIIFAGYTKEMGDFLNMNSGLKSRVPNVFDFEDYTLDELAQIGLLQLHNQQYKVDEAVYRRVLEERFRYTDDHSNGRWVRNFNEKAVRNFSRRLQLDPSADLTLITPEDLYQI